MIAGLLCRKLVIAGAHQLFGIHRFCAFHALAIDAKDRLEQETLHPCIGPTFDDPCLPFRNVLSEVCLFLVDTFQLGSACDLNGSLL